MVWEEGRATRPSYPIRANPPGRSWLRTQAGKPSPTQPGKVGRQPGWVGIFSSGTVLPPPALTSRRSSALTSAMGSIVIGQPAAPTGDRDRCTRVFDDPENIFSPQPYERID